MASVLTNIITSPDPEIRNRSLESFAAASSIEILLDECTALETFRRTSPNLYERVRACFFLYAIHRFYIPSKPDCPLGGTLPYHGYQNLLERRFEEAVAIFADAQSKNGPSDGLSSALASSYQKLGFQILADQVRSSVRSVRGNQWMFRMGHPLDQALRIRPELLNRPTASSMFPTLRELTPVRMDLTHSAWSDIFFLGMDAPEAARVINVSIDLAVQGRDSAPKPPVEAYFRVIDEPLLRLTSVDLGTTADITSLPDVFNFAMDYLGLLKGALIASGIVPPAMEGSGQSLTTLLERIAGPGRGIELISNVNGIPKGSRLAVSTNLLASLIAVCMRATGQTTELEGPLAEPERRLVAARAILGEWIAGSGGGWQDSGGVWPGIKLIEGVPAEEGDPEFGISRGKLLPVHHILDQTEASDSTKQKLQDSLVLVHGGMAQNVGPILEMVTEKYLLRSEAEWDARQDTLRVLDQIIDSLAAGNIEALGKTTTYNFFHPLQTIVPWASNLYTETLISETKSRFGDDFWGFWMLGGMSGGGMGFIVAPHRKQEAQIALVEIMTEARERFQHALPFAMDPVVYDFSINSFGTRAELLPVSGASLPSGYYAMTVPVLVRQDPRSLPPARRDELDLFAQACRTNPALSGMVQTLFDALLPRSPSVKSGAESLPALLMQNGFDSEQHELIRTEIKAGRIGLAQNRLPRNSRIEDVQPSDVVNALRGLPQSLAERGHRAIAAGEAAVVTLSAGVGSRWTQGAGVVKALHPYAKLSGKHRTFLETHVAKSRRVSALYGYSVPHVFTTSHMTHAPIADFLKREECYAYPGELILSEGRAIGLRTVPTERDLRFAWEETAHQVLDEQAQKVRESVHDALIRWAQTTGEASDYTDNLPNQCLHPVGHWYEVPNMLRNGVLLRLLENHPNLKYLLVHNVDTLGANLDAALLGCHIVSDSAMSIEVTPRRLEDRGGGLARVDGRIRLVEGLAMPREEDEFALSYYNSLTTWVTIEKLLNAFNLSREDLADPERVASAVRHVASSMPTYLTLKDVKRRWGYGQEDVFPVAQFEKLWGDMSLLQGFDTGYIAVPRLRGQQLKEQAQLDGWLRDGSAAHVNSICEWSN